MGKARHAVTAWRAERNQKVGALNKRFGVVEQNHGHVSRQAAVHAASDPARLAVCERVMRAPASLRPAFTTSKGLRASRQRAASSENAGRP